MRKGVILLFTLVFIGVISFLIANSLKLSDQQRSMSNERIFLMQLNYLIKDSSKLLNTTTCQTMTLPPLEFDGQMLNIELDANPQTLASVANFSATNPNLFINLVGNATTHETLTHALDVYEIQTGDEAFKYSLDSADYTLTSSNQTSPCLVKIDGELFGFDFNLRYIYAKGSDAKEILYHYTPHLY